MYFLIKASLSIKVILIALILSSCGKAYFPMELSTISRQDRKNAQQAVTVDIIPMSNTVINKANKKPYKRQVVLSGDLNKPAKFVDASSALTELLPTEEDPGSYVIGVGDTLSFYTQEVSHNNTLQSVSPARQIVVGDQGSIYILEIGKIKAVGLNQSQLEDMVYKRLIEEGFRGRFEMSISGFNSKKVFMIVEGKTLSSLPYTNIPMYLDNVLTQGSVATMLPGVDYKVSLVRGNKTFIISLRNMLKSEYAKIRLFPNDKIFIEPLNYRSETVILVGETGMQRSVLIDSNVRHTLSDVIFVAPALNSVTSDFSQIYVLRKNSSKFFAYHLDITNPARIKMASRFEMRPDDIIFIGTQPLSLYSRALSQFLGSTGLTIQARDQIRTELR